MLLFVIIGEAPWILLVSLVGLLYITWLDLRDEQLEPMVKLWWGSLVLLTNVVGYAALRIWLTVRRRRAAAHRSA
jgi:membrane protein DedA with SNARE-associated domain